VSTVIRLPPRGANGEFHAPPAPETPGDQTLRQSHILYDNVRCRERGQQTGKYFSRKMIITPVQGGKFLPVGRQGEPTHFAIGLPRRADMQRGGALPVAPGRRRCKGAV